MKIQIDTEKKTIKIEQDIKLSKMVETMEKLFPNDEWKEFTLETQTVIEKWSNPIIIRDYTDHYYPWWGNVTCVANKANLDADGYKIFSQNSSNMMKVNTSFESNGDPAKMLNLIGDSAPISKMETLFNVEIKE